MPAAHTNIYTSESLFTIIDTVAPLNAILDDPLHPIPYDKLFPVRVHILWSSRDGTLEGDRIELQIKRNVGPVTNKLQRIQGIVNAFTRITADLLLYTNISSYYPAQRITIYIGNIMVFVEGTPEEYGAQMIKKGVDALTTLTRAFDGHLQDQISRAMLREPEED